ncbi:sulfur carrier protein ThiS [Enterovibrio makurazakiensis]|uniref:Sulfur carrier protein ThiS n=1 Tax=Enterovibrio gelatinilyticus TaxID=2899819 RepID=A0ABT5R5R2_9GAMM|nr:sulfur carrier protein ThiS [Enterovibrio sp. ZSDZ42]MDD1795623.1 sulfur carrier protein ThiS [Enterovibrio sp. ZSDZ42]
MKIWLNDNAYVIKDAIQLKALIAELALPEQSVAVAIEGDIVPRHQWQHTPLTEGIQISIFQAIAGG